MKTSDKISYVSGTLLGVWIYQLFFAEVDNILLGGFVISFFIGLIFLYKEKKKAEKDARGGFE